MFINENLVNQFKQYLKNKNRKPNTIYKNISTLEQYIAVMKPRTEKDITLKSIEDYKAYLLEQPTPKTSIYYGKQEKLNIRTVSQKVQNIKNFVKYLNTIYNK